MKVGMFAVLPSEVRYDARLSDRSKLLYAEIAAATNTYGICEEDNSYFAACLHVDPRSITRALDQLIENGHILRLKERGRRKLKVVIKGFPMPDSPDLEIVTRAEDVTIKDFTLKCLSFWEHTLSTVVNDKESYIPLFKEKLKEATEHQIFDAIQGRLKFLHDSAWHNNPVNHAIAHDFNQWFSEHDSIEKWSRTFTKPSQIEGTFAASQNL